MVDKTPAELDPGTPSDTSVVHASENNVSTDSKGHNERDISRLQGTAPDYSSSKTYNLNDLVTESGIVYRNITAITIPETFTPAKWAAIGSGEANTASNVGVGDGVFKQKTGVDLEFKTLTAGTNVTLTPLTDEIEISATDTGEDNTASNVGTGVGTFKQKTGVDLEFKSILAGAGIDVNSLTDEVEIVNTKPSFVMNCHSTQDIGEDDEDRFLAIVGPQSDNGTELNRQNVFPNACILSRMSINVSSNSATGVGFEWVLRINGVDGNLTINVGAGLTGTFQDLTNTDSISNGDLLNYRYNKPTGGTVTIVASAVEVLEP